MRYPAVTTLQGRRRHKHKLILEVRDFNFTIQTSSPTSCACATDLRASRTVHSPQNIEHRTQKLGSPGFYCIPLFTLNSGEATRRDGRAATSAKTALRQEKISTIFNRRRRRRRVEMWEGKWRRSGSPRAWRMSGSSEAPLELIQARSLEAACIEGGYSSSVRGWVACRSSSAPIGCSKSA